MDPLSILQQALSLLGRPGNAVRGAIIDPNHLEGFGRGLSGDQQYDGTDLPGINQLSDDGPSLGPIHLSPRAIGGFAGSALLDPLTYAGGAIGRGAELLGGLGRGAEHAGGLFLDGARLTPELQGTFQGGITHPHFGDGFRLPDWGGSKLPSVDDDAAEDVSPFTDTLPETMRGAYHDFSRAETDAQNEATHNVVMGQTAGDEMHQADAPQPGGFRRLTDLDLFGNSNRMSQDPQHLVENVIKRIGFDPADNAGTEMYPVPERARTGPWPSLSGDGAYRYGGPAENGLGPTNEAIPVGDQATARDRDAMFTSKNQMDVLRERKRAMEGYLLQTGNAEVDPTTKELVIHMKGSQEPVTYEGGGEPNSIEPEAVRQAIGDIEGQMAELSQSEGFMSSRKFQTLQAQRDVAADPSLIDAQRYNDAANNAGNSKWMNENPYRQSLRVDNTNPDDPEEIFTAPQYGMNLDATIRKVYNAMSGWKNRAEVDTSRLLPRAIKQQGQDINESMRGYHRWYNAGKSGIEDPNDLEFQSSQYSTPAVEDGGYPANIRGDDEGTSRQDSSGTVEAGKYPLQVQRGGQVTTASADDRITFPDLLAREQGNDGLYRYLNDKGRGTPGSIPARQLDRLQQEDLLQQRDNIARQSAPDIVYPVRRTQSWAGSVDSHLEDLAGLGDDARSEGDYNVRDLIPQILKAEEEAGNPLTADELIQLVSRIGKPRDGLMARTPQPPTREPLMEQRRQLGLPEDLGATLPDTKEAPNTMILPSGQVVELPGSPAAPTPHQPWNYQAWVQSRMRQRPLPRG